MKKSLFSLICCIGLAHVSNTVAQCVVGGTNFDTKSELCNPDLTDDADGWFSEDVGDELDKLCDGSYSGVVTNIVHQGLQSNFSSTGGSDAMSFEDICTSAAGNKFGSGYSAVVGNARVISPYFTDTKSGNLFVNIGTSQSEAFYSYTVYGLKPGSSVELSCDVYSLLDPTNLETAVTLMNEKASASDMVKEIKIGPLNFGMQSTGSTLTPGSGKINGNGVNMYVCTGGVINNQAAGDVEKAAVDFGKSTSLKIKTTADAQGTVTFYFGRAGGAEFAPIGLDNIEIKGSVQPTIFSQKKMPCCPANPVLLGLNQTFPEGTTYSWSAAGLPETSDSQTFTVTPPDANKTYKVSCKVTMGTCSATSTFDVETKECCSMKNDKGEDVPVAETFVVYEDFGEFTNGGTMYSHTDEKGNTVSMKVQGGMYTDITRPYVTYTAPGVTTGIPAATGAGSSPNDVWMIAKDNPYTPGVNGDASGTGTGGMLIFDLSGATCGQKSIKDLVIYQREVTGLCKGKEISFSALFGAINKNPAGVGEMKIVLREGSVTGKVLYDSKEEGHSKMLYGDEGWLEASHKFTLDHDVDVVIFQVVNVADEYPTSAGDMAVDNIEFSVCTPPDVAVESSLTAEELLDLCTDKPLTLNAQISESAKSYYNNSEGYLFQYTYTDPTTTDADKIKWYDLSDIQTDGSFTIVSPADHEAFAPLAAAAKGDLNIYFRVVIGEKSYLKDNRKDWETLDALSPCRAISISSIPIVAALNCAACSHLDFEDKGVTFTADNGKFDAKKKVVELCAGESVKLGIEEAVHGIDKDGDDYNDYEVKWFKETLSGTALETKKCKTGDDDEAPTISVSYDDVESAGATGVKYIISFHDYFDPTMATTPCDMTDTITVIANPKPKETLTDPNPFCEGTLAQEPDKKMAGYDISWYTDSDTTMSAMASEPVIGGLTKPEPPKSYYSYYYVLTDTKTGCRGDANEYKVEVNKADPNNVDNGQIEYKKTEASGGSLVPLDQKKPTAFNAALSKTDYTLMIGQVEGATSVDEPDLSTSNLGAASPTIPTPEIKDKTSSDDEYLWYYTYLVSPNGCLSDTVLVGVVIKGAPSPTPHNAEYCVNSKTVSPMSAYAERSTDGKPTDELVFYGTDKTTKMAPDDYPDVSTPGKYTYWVAQVGDGGESSPRPIVIEVYGVDEVELAEASHQYCKGATATALENIASHKASSDYVKSTDWEFFETNEPTPNEKTAGASPTMPVSTATAGEYKYYARRTYEVTNTLTSTTEVCYGNHVEYTAEIQSVADPIAGTVTYLKDEGKETGFLKPTEQDKKNNNGTATAIVGDAACADCKIVWYRDMDDAQKMDESEATPTYNDDLEENEEHIYYLKQVNSLGCESKFKPLSIIVSGYPTPKVNDLTVCENSPALTGELEAEISETPNGASASEYKLVWYKSNADGTMDESQEYERIELSPSIQKAEAGNKEKVYKYYVLQRLISSTTKPYAQSAAVTVTVTVGALPRLKSLETAPKCKGESQKLSEMYDVDLSEYDVTYYDENQGSEVTMLTDVVTEAGTYRVRGWYIINQGKADEDRCVSIQQDLKVVFHELDANIVGSGMTCPGDGMDLDAKVTPGGGLELSDVRYAWANDLNSETGSQMTYNTGAEGLDAPGDVMKVTLEVSSEACQGSRAVKKTHIIKVDDRQLNGNISFSEADNTETGKEGKVSDSDIAFRSCGGNVEVKLSGIANEDGGTYTLSGAATGSGAFSSQTDGAATLSLGAGKYTVSYTNKCPTKFEFEILDYSNKAESTNGKMVICEKEPWFAEITDIKGMKPTIEWQKDGTTLPGETNTRLQLNPAKPDDSGVYTYTLYSAGCRYDGKIALGSALKVKPYAVYDENSYKKSYEVVNGDPQSINIEFKVPSSSSEIENGVKWSDANTGFSKTGTGVEINPVTTDYNLHVVAENSDYCKAETDIVILVDARLKMTAELERQEICEGETTKLIVDTAGTGSVLHPGEFVFEVTETTKAGTKTIKLAPNHSTGKLEAEVSPAHDAVYAVTYTYKVGKQDESKTLDLTVHEKFQVEFSEVAAVCEGDMASVEIAKLLPIDTDLDWSDNPAGELLSGSVSGATFMPAYTATGVAPQKKTYKVIAKNGICQDKPFMFDVYVHKPIEGEIKTSDRICQYDELNLDASSYQAETYEWKYEEKDSAMTGATVSLVPDPDYATFTLNMTRGKCSAEVQKYVEVTSAPSVLQVDSVGIRQVEIQMEVGLGTGEFKYIIDGNEEDPEILNNIRDGLSYSEHVVKVIDEVGCSTEFRFVVNNPAIEIPIIISPNDDGVGDRFVVKGLAEGYPEAKVSIFDRWGKLLASYKAGDGTDWDGIYNGTQMPSTDYWYEIQIKEIKKTYTGHFTLIRQ